MKIRGQEDPFLIIGETNERNRKGRSDIVYSLRDINLKVQQGEALGIIGKNGAGKSTLLKIISRVTSPTTGKIRIKGRVTSLLEVGTGFHPELTGRENIYLNGAILGMRKKEIDYKLDEIIDFSGVERYIDTPVKRYSSGMYVRLAFAVAAHLESEILIVDEVLAVGDAEFQKKCLGQMDKISKEKGRTILFVSHNLGAINQLCSDCVLIADGMIDKFGKTSIVINQYLNNYSAHNGIIQLNHSNFTSTGNKKIQFQEIWLKNEGLNGFNRLFSIGDNIEIGFKIKFNDLNEKIIKIGLELKSAEGLKLANMINVDSNFRIEVLKYRVASYKVVLEDIRLYPGTYFLSFYSGDMSSAETFEYVEDCVSFEIIGGGKLTNRRLPATAGILFLTPKWNLNENANQE